MGRLSRSSESSVGPLRDGLLDGGFVAEPPDRGQRPVQGTPAPDRDDRHGDERDGQGDVSDDGRFHAASIA